VGRVDGVQLEVLVAAMAGVDAGAILHPMWKTLLGRLAAERVAGVDAGFLFEGMLR
jgi:hypothetical protein